MFKFHSEQITPNVLRIHGFTDEQMYLIEGRDKAALIDTGTGVGDLKKYIKSYTSKDLIVLLTHGHYDHAMGAGQFENIYMNPKETKVFEKYSETQYRKLFLRTSPDFPKISSDEIMSPIRIEKIKPLEDGMKFSLGGITLEVFECAGHTPGTMGVLISEERLLITGDICNPFTFLFLEESLSINEYAENLSNLYNKMCGRYDDVLFCHGKMAPHSAANIIENVLYVCNQINHGKASQIPYSFADGQQGFIAMPVDEKMNRLDNIPGNIVYKKIFSEN